MKKYLLGLTALFLLLHSEFRFKFFISGEKIGFLCVYEEETSQIRKEEIQKFLSSIKNSYVEWTREVKGELRYYNYLILSRGNLKKEEQSLILEFLKNGGGLVLFLPKQYDERFLRKIGVRTYEIYAKDLDLKLNPEFFKSDVQFQFSPLRGILVKTGYGGEIKIPDKGNVFPERIPVRDFVILGKLINKSQNFLASGIILVKHWLNPWDLKRKSPSNWLLFSGEDINFSNNFYQKLARLFLNPLIVKSARTKFSIYDKGEKINILTQIYNWGKNKKKARLLIQVYHKESLIYSLKMNREFKPGINRFQIRVPPNLIPGFYILKVSILRRGQTLDYFSNGFIVKDEALFREMPELGIKDGEFLINGKREFLWGVNYYESRSGELMWLGPNLSRINQDFELMKKVGFDIVRIHYHHPKWFRDYLKEVNSPVIRFLPQKRYLPSEEDLRILDSIIYLAGLNGLIISLDLFTLVPAEMGNPSGWLSMTERIKNEDKIKAQLEFVKLLAQRYREIPNITWDLWNEPRLNKKQIPELRNWSLRIIQGFRRNGDRHLITIGGNDSLYLADILDYISIHTDKIHLPNNASTQVRKYPSNKPILIQEFWLPKDLDQEPEQVEELRKVIEDVKRSEYKGFMPWGWTRQARLWDNSFPEKWDDELGLFLREDSTLKPTVFLEFK